MVLNGVSLRGFWQTGFLALVLVVCGPLAYATTFQASDSNSGVGDGTSVAGSISADGNDTVYSSDATNLAPNDTNGFSDIFLFKLDNLTNHRISSAINGTQSNGDSFEPVISGSGRFIVFLSKATNLVAGSPAVTSIFIYDRDVSNSGTFDQAGNFSLSRVNILDTTGNPVSFDSSAHLGISANGRYLVFATPVALVNADTNGKSDVYLYDRDADGNGIYDEAGGTSLTLVSAGGNGASADPYISANGTTVLFDSFADNFVSGDTNGFRDVFAYDIASKTITRISILPDGTQGNSDSSAGGLSADGSVIAFSSFANNLAPNDANLASDAFMYQSSNGAVTLISRGTDGISGDGASFAEDVSADGSTIIFRSQATDFDSLRSTQSPNIYSYTIADKKLRIVSLTNSSAPANGTVADNASVSSDGSFVSFTNNASNLTIGGVSTFNQVFIADTRVSIQLFMGNLGNIVVGNTAVVTFLIQNSTNNDASGLVLTATLPAGYKIIQYALNGATCTLSGNTLTCKLPQLLATFNATGEIDFATNAPGTLTVSATVTSQQRDVTTVDNSAMVTTTISAKPGGGGSIGIPVLIALGLIGLWCKRRLSAV